MKLNEKLMKIRKEKGLSQEEFGNEINVSRQAVSKWETGETKPDVEKIQEIGKKFNISFDYLLNDEIDKEIKLENKTCKKSKKKSLLKMLLVILLIYLLICIYKFIAFYRFYLIANSFSEENYSMINNFQSSDLFDSSYDSMMFCTDKIGNEIIETSYSDEEFITDKDGRRLPYSITYINTGTGVRYTLSYDEDMQKYYYQNQVYYPETAEQNHIKETTLSSIPSNFKDIFLASINPCYYVSIFNREIIHYSTLYHAKQKVTLTEDCLVNNIILKTEYNGNVSSNYSYDYVPGHFEDKDRIKNPVEKYKDMIIYE